MTGVDAADLRSWIGKTAIAEDRVVPVPLRALSATLGREDGANWSQEPVPPGWHWLFFLPLAMPSELGDDGHPSRGGFLPPVPLPRRMWAGGQMEFHRPLLPDDRITRHSRIEDVQQKRGRTGPLTFVKVLHEIRAEGQLAILERQDIVYRDRPQGPDDKAAGVKAPAEAEWCRYVVPDTVLLFRYSALTFNSHRIHFDRPYAMESEGYRGLVVHGPLIATLLLDLLHREQPTGQVGRFEFRSVGPLFANEPFALCGRMEDSTRVSLWARTRDGNLAMEAKATLV